MEGGSVHLVDLLLWLTGERPSKVSAIGNRMCTEKTSFRYQDFVAATLQYCTGQGQFRQLPHLGAAAATRRIFVDFRMNAGEFQRVVFHSENVGHFQVKSLNSRRDSMLEGLFEFDAAWQLDVGTSETNKDGSVPKATVNDIEGTARRCRV